MISVLWSHLFQCVFGCIYSVLSLYSHNLHNFVIGISNMMLNEGSIQISLQMLAKKSLGSSYLVLELIFIKIRGGPFVSGKKIDFKLNTDFPFH